MKRPTWSGIVGAGELAAVGRCSGSVWRRCNWVVSFETWETRAWIARLETAPCSSWWSMRELLRDKKSLNSDALAGSILVRSFSHGTESSRSNCEWKTDSLYLTTPKHSGGEDKLAVQVQTPKHSGGADIIGSAGAVKPAVQSLQPSGNTETRPGENSLRTWKTDTESKKPQE